LTVRRLLGVLLCVAALGSASARAQSSVWIDELTWTEVRDAIAAGRDTALVYAGSSEQNGPHLVIGKHNVVARAAAERIARTLGNALVYPVLPYAVTGDAAARTGHMAYPGSVTLLPEVYFGVVWSVARSALAAGFRHVVVMGDHGDGQDQLDRAVRALAPDAARRRARVQYVSEVYEKTEADFAALLRARGLPADDGHAGIADTAVLLYLQPAAVRVQRIADASPATGVAGQPALATAELGERYLELKVRNAVQAIREAVAVAP